MIEVLNFGTAKQQLEVTKRFYKISDESISTINKVIGAGIVPKFVEFLQSYNINLQIVAACVLGNIAAGDIFHVKCIIDAGALPALVKLLSSPSENVQEHAVWCLGNIACNGSKCRDLLLDHGVLSPLLQSVNKLVCFFFLV
jgi:hypothetical protein